MQQIEQKASDWERKCRQAEMQCLEAASMFDRDRNQLKASEQDKADRLKSCEGQLRDCISTL